MTTSYIKIHGGVPHLFVNGEPINEMAYITYWTHNNRYSDFVEAGYKLFSVPVYFAEMGINEQSGIPPFCKGIFDGDTPDFSTADARIRELLSVYPDAMIFPRININLSEAWEKAHPDELASSKFRENYKFIFSSDLWAEEVKRQLTVYISHLEASDFRDNIVGYQIAAGQTEEWFPMDPDSGRGKRASEKFKKRCNEFGLVGTVVEEYEFLSDIIAERIIEVSTLVKELVGGRVAVGTFYGYTFVHPDRKRSSHALGTLLRSDAVDFICSPVVYEGGRAPGFDHYNMLPIDSLKEHGKLYFVENDTRTHLSKAPYDIPNYRKPIWFGYDKTRTTEIIKLHFSRALTHGHAMWWFDMWGGWYDDPDYMALMKKLRVLGEESLRMPRGSAAEVALIIDERALITVDSDENYLHDIVHRFMVTLGNTATPYDVYLSSDAEAVKDRYKAAICLLPCSDEALATFPEDRRLDVELVGRLPGEGELCGFFEKADITRYTDRRAVVYASESYICLHTVEDGEITLTVDGKTDLTDIITGEKVFFPIYANLGKTYLFSRGNH